MGRLKEMKQAAEEIKERLEATELRSEGAGGDIKIVITGMRRIRSIEISAALQHGNKQELEEHLAVAMNRAIDAADKLNEEEMKKAAGGLLPGL